MRNDVFALTAVIAAVAAVAAVGLWFGSNADDGRIAAADGRPAVSRAPVSTRAPATRAAPAARVTMSTGRQARAPLDRYLSGIDLWDTYQVLRRSADGGESWVAETIVRNCFYLTRDISIVQRILAGEGLVVFDPMTREEMDLFITGKGEPRTHRAMATDDQIAAAREIASRCAPFSPMTSAEFQAQRNDVIGRRQHADDPVAVAESIQVHRLQATDARLRRVLASEDPLAIDLIGEELSSRLAMRTGRALTDDEATAALGGLRLVQCDLGNDCDANSQPALVACMHRADHCRLDVPAQVLAAATPAVQAMITAQRQRMLDAIHSGDYALWGL